MIWHVLCIVSPALTESVSDLFVKRRCWLIQREQWLVVPMTVTETGPPGIISDTHQAAELAPWYLIYLGAVTAKAVANNFIMLEGIPVVVEQKNTAGESCYWRLFQIIQEVLDDYKDTVKLIYILIYSLVPPGRSYGEAAGG